MMSNYKSKTTVYEKRADGSLFPLGQVVPNIDERVRQLENYPSAVVVTKPTIDGGLSLPDIGGAVKLTVSAESLLVDGSITKFEYWLNNGEKQTAIATLNTATISIETPEGAQAGESFDLYVRAYDNYGSSNINSVTLTVVTVGVSTPTISGKTTEVVKGEATFTGSEFTFIGGEGVHDKSDWILYKQSASSVEVWSSKNDTEHLTTVPEEINTYLESGEAYILKLRYHDSTMDLWSDYGSIMFTMADIAVKTPTLSGTTINVVQGEASFTGSPFEIIGVSEGNHDKSDWMLVKADSPSSKIWGSENDSINKTSSPQSLNEVLEVSTTYIIKVRYHDATTGAWSDWGQLEFATANEFFEYNYIGEPGAYGFGVGVCDDEEGLAALGLEPMEGTFNPKSENYGNYQRIDGKGVWVFIPAFCYKFETNEKSLSYFTVKSFKEFDFNESAANEQGYILHRAFIDGGIAQKGFFIAKYLMSKGVKSVKNGITLSLAESSYANASSQAEGNGAIGVAYDALTLSKTLGQQYNCASVYMYSALAMLSLVQGWNATSTDTCAWYDPNGTNNFPKGCNNGALGDCNDAEILYQSADGLLTKKPNTGSANHFARTTHNGLGCGICDVNGCIRQVAIGALNDNGYYIYVSSDTAKLTDYTKDNIMMMGEASLYASALKGPDTRYEYKWGSTKGNCLYAEQSGLNRTLCGVWPSKLDSFGTNEFGTDKLQLKAAAAPSKIGMICCAGSWNNAQLAGIWYRVMDSSYGLWNSTATDFGFRSGAYLPAA